MSHQKINPDWILCGASMSLLSVALGALVAVLIS